jgi:2-(1,2-epoxy-1,2-dihydrophenyl)acetyl-CoA isomerase
VLDKLYGLGLPSWPHEKRRSRQWGVTVTSKEVAVGDEKLLLRSESDGVVTLTLNRPQCLNALSDELVLRLSSELRRVDESAVAVVLRGAGRAFCAGHDLKEAAERAQQGPRTREEIVTIAEGMQEITRSIRACPAVVIGAVHGYAVGGGAEVALACDLVVAARSTVFGFPETGVGLLVTNGFTGILPRFLGPARAKELMILGEQFSAEQAAAMGLLTRVVEDDELDAGVAEVVARIRSRGPLAVRLTKDLIDQGFDDDLERTLRREIEASIRAEMSDDGAEGAAAFAEGRTPAFVGR